MRTADIQVTLIDHMGSDLSVVNAARVSFEKESDWVWSFAEGEDHSYPELSQADSRLIKYLAKHKHTSPFNHAFASFRVKAPLFVAAQLKKHKFMPWNEVSRRYVSSEPEFFVPEYWRLAAENVKQGSTDEPYKGSVMHPVGNFTPNALITQAAKVYKHLIDNGVCAEQARMVLPQSMMTEWIWSGSLGAIADMCRLRLDPHAQKESRVVAEAISAEMQKLYPVSWQALMEVK